MLSICFENSRTIEQLSSGPAGSYLDEFASHLHLDGYASGTARRSFLMAELLCRAKKARSLPA